jgi:hypothetical protein
MRFGRFRFVCDARVTHNLVARGNRTVAKSVVGILAVGVLEIGRLTNERDPFAVDHAQKWSKGKMKEKANNQVLFEQVRIDRRTRRGVAYTREGCARAEWSKP